MNDIFSKLNSLKSIEPSESWVVEAREKVLSEAPIFGRESVSENIIDKKSNLGFGFQDLFHSLSFKKVMVPAFSLVFVLFTGIFTVGASKSSLPGDLLYSLKIANEDVILAVASEEKRAEIEMEYAGRRLEEIAEISKKTSDVEQQKKIGQLVEKFEEKVKSANDNLTKINKSGEKVKVAKVINTQSEKYTEVLAKTTENLPAVIKDEISEEVAKAIDSNEKISLASLAAMVKGMTNEDRDEIMAIVKGKIGEKEGEEDVTENERDTEDNETGKSFETDGEDQDAIEEINKADSEEDTERGIEKDREELLELLDNFGNNGSEDGDVRGDEDESSQSDSADVSEEYLSNDGAEEGNAEEITSEKAQEVVVEEMETIKKGAE